MQDFDTPSLSFFHKNIAFNKTLFVESPSNVEILGEALIDGINEEFLSWGVHSYLGNDTISIFAPSQELLDRALKYLADQIASIEKNYDSLDAQAVVQYLTAKLTS